MKQLGLLWRPLGYGALLVAALTGIVLALRDWESDTAFQVVLWVKVAVFVCLLAVSYLHNFVLGPRLQAEIREGREQLTRPRLVARRLAELLADDGAAGPRRRAAAPRLVRAEPEGIDTASVVDALQDGWGFEAQEADYAAVGGGSYHWLVADASGGRAFVSVDDLDKKAWLGDTRDDAFDGLRCAFDTAASLRESGLGFVVAPTRTLAGASLLRLDARYSLALFPFVEGEAGEFGTYESDDERCGVAALLAELHGATAGRIERPYGGLRSAGPPPPRGGARGAESRWTGGPLSEPARAAIAAGASELAELIVLADRLAADARTRGRELRRDARRAARRERHPKRREAAPRGLGHGGARRAAGARPLDGRRARRSGARELYERASGRLLDDAALDFFRLTWDLKDIAEYLNVLRGSHQENEDTLRHYRALTQIGDVWDRWSRGASPASGW